MKLWNLILFLLISPNLFAQIKTEKDHWMGTNLTFEQGFGGNLNRANCEFNLTNFLGCMAALNTGFSMIHQKTFALLPDTESVDPIQGFKQATNFQAYETDLAKVYLDRKNLFSLVKPINFDGATFLLSTLLKQSGQEAFITGLSLNRYLMYAFDPHTHMTPLTLLDERAQSTTVVKILGIIYEAVKWKGEKRLIISNILSTSPFALQGVELGSVIYKVNGKEDFDSMVKELEGNQLEITLEDEKGFKTIIVEPTEQAIPTLESEIITDRDHHKFGYIKLSSFNDETSCSQIRNAATDFLDQEVSGFILDLRRNGGGKINTARCILNLFLEPGSFDWLELDLQSGKLGTSRIRNDRRVFVDIHTTVLINGFSASAAEATALSLQAYRKAFVVGERSFGKGTAQKLQVFNANQDLGISLTTSKYLGPHKVSPQLQGVAPDFEAFPRYFQEQPTPYRREADLYSNAIVNTPVVMPVMPERLEQISSIKKCLDDSQVLESSYLALSKFKRAVWDYQLATAEAVLGCANKLKLPFFSDTNIPTID